VADCGRRKEDEVKKSELINLWAEHFADPFPDKSYPFWREFKKDAVTYAFEVTARKLRREKSAFGSMEDFARYASAIMRQYNDRNEERTVLEPTPVPQVKGQANRHAVGQKKSTKKRLKRITPKSALGILNSCYVPGDFNLKRLGSGPEASLRLKRLVGHIDECALAWRINEFLGIKQKQPTRNEEVILNVTNGTPTAQRNPSGPEQQIDAVVVSKSSGDGLAS
jgi:hypothetical protein